MSASNNRTKSSANPLITVAIPTRNRAALLQACVASALNQTYRNIEVVVSDNASTDSTSEVLKSISDPRLRHWVNAENVGLNGNWNKCLDRAAGEYFLIIADDNILQPTFLEKCVSLLREEPRLPVIVGGYDVVMTDENRTVPPALTKKLSTGIWVGTGILIEHLRGNLTYGTLSCVARTDLLRRNGGFPDQYIVGEELVLGQLLCEGRAGLINERCASQLFHTHPTKRYSASMDLDTRFSDVYGVMVALSQSVARMIPDEKTRREVQKHARTFVWYRAIQELAFYRQEGASLLAAARHLWGWRSSLAQCSFTNLMGALRWRPVGRIVLPQPAIRLMRS